MDKTGDTQMEVVACDICLKEVPASVVKSAEGLDYVMHFCGLECFDKWKRRMQSIARDDKPPSKKFQ